jgi:hypothetical protein
MDRAAKFVAKPQTGSRTISGRRWALVAPSSGDRQKVPSDKGFLSPGNWFHLSSDNDWKSWLQKESERSEGRRLVWNWFKISWQLCFAPFRFLLRPFWVACGRNIPSLETEGSVDAMKTLVNHETGNTKGCDSETSTGRSDPRRRDRPE